MLLFLQNEPHPLWQNIHSNNRKKCCLEIWLWKWIMLVYLLYLHICFEKEDNMCRMNNIFLIYFHYFIGQFYCIFKLKSKISARVTSWHILAWKNQKSKVKSFEINSKYLCSKYIYPYPYPYIYPNLFIYPYLSIPKYLPIPRDQIINRNYYDFCEVTYARY